MTTVEHIILDKDGTITDLHIYWKEIILRRAAALAKITPHYSRDLCATMGFDLITGKMLQRGPVGVKSREEVISRVALYTELPEDVVRAIFNDVQEAFKPHRHKFIKLLPGVKTFMQTRYAYGIKFSLMTGDLTDNAREALAYTGLLDYFDHVLGQDAMQYPKDSGIDAWEISTLYKGTTVVIGDTLTDLEMARRANLRCYSVATGQVPFHTLDKENRGNTFTGIGELPWDL